MVGRTISHYKVLEKIGQGGMGEVYRAEDTNMSCYSINKTPSVGVPFQTRAGEEVLYRSAGKSCCL